MKKPFKIKTIFWTLAISFFASINFQATARDFNSYFDNKAETGNLSEFVKSVQTSKTGISNIKPEIAERQIRHNSAGNIFNRARTLDNHAKKDKRLTGTKTTVKEFGFIKPTHNFKTIMPDNRLMTLTKIEEYYDGTLVYKGWHRNKGRAYLILAKTAYEYRLICKPVNGIYTIVKSEKAVIAFPSGENHLLTAMIRVIRFVDVHIKGSFDEIPDFNGRSCY